MTKPLQAADPLADLWIRARARAGYPNGMHRIEVLHAAIEVLALEVIDLRADRDRVAAEPHRLAPPHLDSLCDREIF